MESGLTQAQLEFAQLKQHDGIRAEDASEGLRLLLAQCSGQTQHMSEAAALASLQTLSTVSAENALQSTRLRSELVKVLVDFVASWGVKSEDVTARALSLLAKAAQFPPSAAAVSEAAGELSALQSSLPHTSLRALAFRAMYELVRPGGLRGCDERLSDAVEPTLTALETAASKAEDAAYFSLLIFAVCWLSPLSDAPHTLPKLANDFASTLVLASEAVIGYVQRRSLELPTGLECGCGRLGHEHLRVEEHHVLIFFGTLPRLQAAFGHGSVRSTNESGDTVAHRLASANIPKCLDIYLHGCGAEFDPQQRNGVGLTPLDVATAKGHDLCLNVLARHNGSFAVPLISQKAARAMARASSVPLPPLDMRESDSPVPSFSWIEPDTSNNRQAAASREERLQRFEAQAGLSAPNSSTTVPNAQDSLEERKRILQLALAQLEPASHGRPERSAHRPAATYFQNPAGDLPVHSNPFAGFVNEARQSRNGSDTQLLDQGPMRMPSAGVLRTASMGSLGTEGTSPPQCSLDFRPRSYDEGFRSGGGGSSCAKRSADWESAATPSTRMWLGNIAAHVTVPSLYDVFGRFGQLTDAAVFPARIGPLGYAFVNFLDVSDAACAFDALNNTSVPPLTGSKLLKIRYKPAQQQPKIFSEGIDSTVTQPSSHLWLGNVLTRPNKLAIEDLFGRFGVLTSVRVFPGKTFAFVNYNTITEAAAAMHHLDGRIWQVVSGTKPMVVRYQTGPQLGLPLPDPLGLRQLSVPGLINGPPPPIAGIPALPLLPVMPAARHSSLPVLPMPVSTAAESVSTGFPGGLTAALSGLEGQQSAMCDVGQDLEALLPAINLSNRLNPNNMHYDRDLAELYKNMTKVEKEALWADDRSTQQLLAMQAPDQLPADLSMLGLPPVQASLLANHLSGASSLSPWTRSTQGEGSQQSTWGASLPSQSLSQGMLATVQQGLSGLDLTQGQQMASLSSLSSGPSSTFLTQLSAGHMLPPATLAEAMSFSTSCRPLQAVDLSSRLSR